MEEIGLVTTTLIRWDNAKMYFPNSHLLASPLQNVSRSYNYWESLSLAVDITLTQPQFSAVAERVK